jgi:hypothetical protein
VAVLAASRRSSIELDVNGRRAAGRLRELRRTFERAVLSGVRAEGRQHFALVAGTILTIGLWAAGFFARG